MNVYTPLATGQKIPQSVLDSINMQSIRLTHVICESAGEINSEHNYTSLHISSELKNRNDAIDLCLKSNDPFLFMCNSDVLQLRDSNFEDQIDYLLNNKDYGACALPFEWCQWNHIDIASICIKREVLEKGFLFENRHGYCLCKEFMEDMEKLGYKYGYVNNIPCIQNGIPRT